MNILYIYKEYMGRKRRYGEEMSRLGHKVSFMRVKDKKTPNQISGNIIKKYSPDIVWLLSPFYVHYDVVSKEAVEYIKHNNIPLITCGTFNTQMDYTKSNSTWKQFDFFFVRNKEFCSYLKGIGVNAYYIPMGFYKDQYYPISRKKDIKISFAGNPQTTVNKKLDKRMIYLKALKQFNIKVFGRSFNKRGLEAYPYNSHKQENNIYARSEINLDLPFINSPLDFYKNKYHLKNRFFEIPASNNFLMTLRCDEFTSILDESMVGYFDDSIESMVESVSMYLKDKNKRKEMAFRAYKEVINKHTFLHRTKQMFSIIGKL